MYNSNRILTTLNQPLVIDTILVDANGNPLDQNTFEGNPLGTSNNGADGELGQKVIIIGDRSAVVNNPSVATPTQVASSATSVTLLATNSTRKGATIYNGGSTTLSLSFVTPATIAGQVLPIATGGYYEVPFGYTGPIYGIWAGSPTGNANINSF